MPRTDTLEPTAMSDDTKTRIENLETHAAHQARMLEELNEVVSAQAREIDRLTRRLKALAEHVEELEDLRAGPAPITKPPHY